MWPFIFGKGLTTAHMIFFYSSYATFVGPLFLQFFPLALGLTCLVVGIKSGYWYDRNHGLNFWLVWSGALVW